MGKKVYSDWLGISRSDRPQPCGSAVAGQGQSSGDCSSSGPESRVLALGGAAPSLPVLSSPPNGRGTPRYGALTMVCRQLSSSRSTRQRRPSSHREPRSRSGLQKHQAQMECRQLQEILREIKSTSLTTSLPNRPEMCN